MEISRKSGIKTVKHTKVNDELYEMISEESAKFAGGIEEFQREAYARYFEKSEPEKPVVISLMHPANIEDRTENIYGKISIETRMFFVNLMNETGDYLENIVGELLTKFAENPANIPTIIRKPVTVPEPVSMAAELEPVIIPEPVAVAAEPEPVNPNYSSMRKNYGLDEPEPEKPANIIEINLDELVTKSVIEDLKKFGFDEFKYLSFEVEKESRQTFENMMRDRLAQKDTIIENLRNGANPTEDMKKGFKGLLDFSIILYKSHLERNGVKGVFTRITKENMLELCPQELKYLFV